MADSAPDRPSRGDLLGHVPGSLLGEAGSACAAAWQATAETWVWGLSSLRVAGSQLFFRFPVLGCSADPETVREDRGVLVPPMFASKAPCLCGLPEGGWGITEAEQTLEDLVRGQDEGHTRCLWFWQGRVTAEGRGFRAKQAP